MKTELRVSFFLFNNNNSSQPANFRANNTFTSDTATSRDKPLEIAA